MKRLVDKLKIIMVDRFSDDENSSIVSNDLDEVDGGGTDPEHSVQVENADQIEIA